MTTFVALKNIDPRFHEMTDVMESNPFMLPDMTHVASEGFTALPLSDLDSKQFYGTTFIIAEKKLDQRYLKYMAHVKQIKKSSFKEFANNLLLNELANLKPTMKFVPIVQSKTDSLLMIGATGKTLERALAYWNNATEFLPGGINLHDMYVTPPSGYEYNNAIELMELATQGKMVMRNCTLTDLDDRISSGAYDVNRIRFCTNRGTSFMVSTEGTVSSMSMLKEGMINCGEYQQYQEIFDCLYTFCNEGDGERVIENEMSLDINVSDNEELFT
jgi:hypothetical protein